MGVNINDKAAPFTAMILAGEKTVETRRKRTLDSVIGKRVGIVRTGKGKATMVGYATVGEPVRYESKEQFRLDYQRHRVEAGSQHDCGDEGKWGYPLVNVEATEPRIITRRGIVLRRID